MWIYFWAFYPVPLIYKSVFVPVTYCFDYCSCLCLYVYMCKFICLSKNWGLTLLNRFPTFSPFFSGHSALWAPALCRMLSYQALWLVRCPAHPTVSDLFMFIWYAVNFCSCLPPLYEWALLINKPVSLIPLLFCRLIV